MEHKAEEQRATYRIREAARVAGCGDKAMRDAVNSGRIPHLRFGRNIVIPRSAFMKWLDAAGEKSA